MPSRRAAVTDLPISVVCLVSYDIERLFESLESYYGYVSEILFGVEKRNVAMSMRPIEVPPEFYTRVRRYPKVQVVQREFYSHDRRPIENDTHQRNVLGTMTRPENWVVQIDADEVLLNPEDFFPWLAHQSDDVLVMGQWVQLFKEVGSTRQEQIEGSTPEIPVSKRVEGPPALRKFLAVCREDGQSLYSEGFPVATRRRGAYTCARYTKQRRRNSPLWVLHYSWARPEASLIQKVSNWGHSEDFDQEAYLDLWRDVSLKNYTEVSDFHPTVAGQWPRLACLSLDEIRASVRDHLQRDSRLHRTLARARRLAARLTGRSHPPGGPSRFARSRKAAVETDE